MVAISPCALTVPGLKVVQSIFDLEAELVPQGHQRFEYVLAGQPWPTP